MGLFNFKKLVALNGVITPDEKPRDALGRWLSGSKEQIQNQRIEALEFAIVNLRANGGCKCATKEPEVKSVTKAKPKKS